MRSPISLSACGPRLAGERHHEVDVPSWRGSRSRRLGGAPRAATCTGCKGLVAPAAALLGAAVRDTRDVNRPPRSPRLPSAGSGSTTWTKPRRTRARGGSRWACSWRCTACGCTCWLGGTSCPTDSPSTCSTSSSASSHHRCAARLDGGCTRRLCATVTVSRGRVLALPGGLGDRRPVAAGQLG